MVLGWKVETEAMTYCSVSDELPLLLEEGMTGCWWPAECLPCLEGAFAKV